MVAGGWDGEPSGEAGRRRAETGLETITGSFRCALRIQAHRESSGGVHDPEEQGARKAETTPARDALCSPEREAAALVPIEPSADLHRHRVAAAVFAVDEHDGGGVEGRRDAGGGDQKGGVPAAAGCAGGRVSVKACSAVYRSVPPEARALSDCCIICVDSFLQYAAKRPRLLHADVRFASRDETAAARTTER